MLVVGGLLGLAPSTLHKVRRGCIIMAVVSLPWGGGTIGCLPHCLTIIMYYEYRIFGPNYTPLFLSFFVSNIIVHI